VNNILKQFEKKETEYMRLQRHKMSVDDFDLLTMIGKGAFGEVRVCRERSTGNVYAMKKLKKSEMLRRGQFVILFNRLSMSELKEISLLKWITIVLSNYTAHSRIVSICI